MKFLISLAIFCIAATYGQTQKQLHGDTINPDRIYFDDNRPGAREINQNTQQGVYRNEVPLRSGIANNQPSIELLPPYKAERTGGPSIDISRKQDSVDVGVVTQSPISMRFDNVSLGVTNFAVNLMKTINELQRGNTVVSPLSIVTLLGLLQQGAGGTSLEQISKALQMSPEGSAAAYQRLNENLQNRNTRNVLKTANSVFIADAFDINPQFKRIAQKSFGSEVTPLNFGNPVQASQKINNWVAAKTNNKIEKLVSPDFLDINSQLVLVNTVYFKGLWEIRFRPESTKLREFQLSNGSVQMRPFMRMRRYFRTGVDKTNGAQVISLPFESDQYSLMVILPSKSSSLSALISSLTHAQLMSYLRFSPKEVMLDMPKFTIRADTDLSPVYQKMGITNLFTPYAELHGLGTYRTFSPQISSAIHSAMLSIDEDGGTGAAATAFAVVALSYDDPSVLFNADRPFLAIIWDNQAAIPIFTAKIEDPIP